ncbi:hypothetical protein [Chamaesiphon polymorphus]|uniref:Tetratricopeptide repeat protein n=1 Tax=Chamaesiphon polymorphus CCALA 037 TaxID=2107692 RepID=A0A2T1G1T1_9CYAN|nr:hypothetical protein [Chamaesiphon polymorphus]PSB51203.1 hypothetical protein C7B77_21865 [Chamaesiphon polymorphus CCALA 037]
MTRQNNNYGRDQFNIENLHFNPAITGQKLFANGLQFLNQRDYKQASVAMSEAINVDPSMYDAYYYFAIALLSGNRPKKIDEWTIRDIEEKLSIAINRDSENLKCYTLWAIVKYGFYTMNRFIEKPPTSDQLFKKGESIQYEHAREILYHLNDPLNPYWVHLYNKFGQLN